VFYIHVCHFHETEMFHIVKVTCPKDVTKLCSKLSHRSLDVEIMAAFGMVYP
jgi:hypothetical protein